MDKRIRQCTDLHESQFGYMPGSEKKIPNDFSPGHYLVRWVRVKG